MARNLYFNNRDEFFRISLDNIVYFEADKNYTFMQLATGQRLTFTFSLQKMQTHLAASLGDDARIFARVGKSHIVNLTMIYNIDIAKRVLRLMTPVQGRMFNLKISLEALRNLRALFVK
ncbi:MAG: LytTR family transcriptional regulator [Bacteroides sp.]|nr:LytTR family transcriptional regulator [Bacteroides sp.]MCM1413709.1 LytTR family transcriptional regulator [Bacteroides sp.]MCM1471888.1 LytTR family transcriptional regulator [Bacteroides sp.]